MAPIPPRLPRYPDFEAAHAGSDLILGNQRAVAAVTDTFTAQTMALRDTRDELARPWPSEGWSGPASDAFEAHRAALARTTDVWLDADATVHQALETHLDALTAAQDQAETALAGWKHARSCASLAPRWYLPEQDAASNAAAVRAQITDDVVGGAHRAHALLETARTEFDTTGEQVVAHIRAATEALRAAPLPRLAPSPPSPEHDVTAPATGDTGRVSSSPVPTSVPHVLADPSRPASPRPSTVTVHPGDTLSTIARRELGNADRWPEIFRLNHHHLVGPHATLTNPNDIQPGWMLRLPADGSVTVPVAPPQILPPSPQHAPSIEPSPAQGDDHHHAPSPELSLPPGPDSETAPLPPSNSHSFATPPTSGTPGTGQPSAPATPMPPASAPAVPSVPAGSPRSEPPMGAVAPPAASAQPSSGWSSQPAHAASGGGLDASDGLLVGGAAIAAAVGGGVLAARLRRRQSLTGTAGHSGDGEQHADDHTASERSHGGQPHVYSLSPDLTAVLPHPPATTGTTAMDSLPGATRSQAASWGAPPSLEDRDGCDVLLDAAAHVGVGLIGSGSVAAARAILARMLAATPGATVRLTMPAHDTLLDRRTTSPASVPTRASIAATHPQPVGTRSISAALSASEVHLADSLTELLDEVETDLLTRTRLIEDTAGRAPVEPMLLVVIAPRRAERLRSAIDLGAMLGIGLVVLGAWPTGLTCLVDRDGSVRRVVGDDVHEWSSALNNHLVFANSSADLHAVREVLAPATTAVAASALLTSARPSERTRGSLSTSMTGSASAPRDRSTPLSGQSSAMPAQRSQPEPASTIEHGFDITKFAGSMPESETDTRTATVPSRHRDSEPAAPEPADVDPAFTTPRPRPHVAPITPRPDPAPATLAPEASGDVRSVQPLCDTEMEVIATAETPVIIDAQLEIFCPRPAPELGARLRPGQAPLRPCEDTPTATTSTVTAGSTTSERVGPALIEGTTAPTAVNEDAADGPCVAVPVQVDVLGAPQVFWQPDTADMASMREVTKAFQPRTRELLVFLALHPHGVSREALLSALWPNTPAQRTTNVLNTTMSRLRRSVSTATGGAVSEIVEAGENRYRLDPELVDVDFWHFDTAVAARRAATTDQQRVDAYRAIVDSYGGALADGMSTEWIETAREAIRRDAIDAVAALARALVDDDPQQTLDLLEIARAFDPHNEALYRDIMRLQDRLGLIDAVPRTLTLLTTRLAEIDNRPTEYAIGLATRLRQRHDDDPSARPGPATGGERDRSAAG